MYVRSQPFAAPVDPGPGGIRSIARPRAAGCRRRGLGATAPTMFAAAQPGVTQQVSDAACVLAGGTPADASNLPLDSSVSTAYNLLGSVVTGGSPNGCMLPAVADLPWWCGLPGAISLFSDCDVNSTTQANMSALMVYTTAQGAGGPATGVGPATAIAEVAAAADAASLPDCSSWALANQPMLSSFLGPQLAGSMFGSAAVCTPDPSATPAWMIYAGLALLAAVVWGAIAK
jgi:hypothetical protein